MSMDPLAIKAYINKHQERFIEELMDFLRIPSISGEPRFGMEVRAAANFVKDRLLEAGVDEARLIETAGHPIVYGEKKIGEHLPTLLIYGHYDVQPSDPDELWDTPPFEPEIRDDKIYARGAADDKGQVYFHIKAFEAMVACQQLPCNVKFLIEGEEEIGSPHLVSFLQDKNNHVLLQADALLVSDTNLISMEQPSIQAGLRGIIYLEVTVTSANRDLHSGLYGGAVENPIQALCRMIAALKDDDQRITIPGFYDRVLERSNEERVSISKIPFDLDKYKASIGVQEIVGEKGYSTLERIGIRPSLDVNGIWGGYTNQGTKTVLPSKASAKISLRLVPHQEAEKVVRDFEAHIRQLLPSHLKVAIHVYNSSSDPITIEHDSLALQTAYRAMEETFKKKPIITYEGGSVPILLEFKKQLDMDIAMMGFGLASDAIHSPNEHFGLKNFSMGLEATISFCQHFARLKALQK